jgi:hypothetical protein
MSAGKDSSGFSLGFLSCVVGRLRLRLRHRLRVQRVGDLRQRGTICRVEEMIFLRHLRVRSAFRENQRKGKGRREGKGEGKRVRDQRGQWNAVRDCVKPNRVDFEAPPCVAMGRENGSRDAFVK